MIKIEPIGFIKSPFKTKFAVPRQPGLAKSIKCQIHLNPEIDFLESTDGLESFSHLWLLFHFHFQKQSWNTKVAPPRLGGKKKVGVFASRSPFRPNPIGLSVVKLQEIIRNSDSPHILITGGDFVDKTPIYDIKPYIQYSDAITDATDGWLENLPEQIPLSVLWNPEALRVLDEHFATDKIRAIAIQNTIEETLGLDPRPGYERGKPGKPGQTWGAEIDCVNVKWSVNGETCVVESLSIQTDIN